MTSSGSSSEVTVQLFWQGRSFGFDLVLIRFSHLIFQCSEPEKWFPAEPKQVRHIDRSVWIIQLSWFSFWFRCFLFYFGKYPHVSHVISTSSLCLFFSPPSLLTHPKLLKQWRVLLYILNHQFILFFFYLSSINISKILRLTRQKLTISLLDPEEHHQGADEKHSSDHAGSYHVHLLLQREKKKKNKHVAYISPSSYTARTIRSILSHFSIFNS